MCRRLTGSSVSDEKRAVVERVEADVVAGRLHPGHLAAGYEDGPLRSVHGQYLQGLYGRGTLGDISARSRG